MQNIGNVGIHPSWVRKIEEIEKLEKTEKPSLDASAYLSVNHILISKETFFCDDLQSIINLKILLQKSNITAVAIDTEYRYPNQPITTGGRHWSDIRSVQPICLSLCAAVNTEYDFMETINAVIDLRNNDLLEEVQNILSMYYLFIAHNISAELFVLWSLALIEPLMIFDTFIAAKVINLGLSFVQHKEKPEDIINKIERDELEKVKQESFYSLLGQCLKYTIKHKFANSKADLQEQFLNLAPNDKLSDEQIEYALEDAKTALNIFFAQQKEITKKALNFHLYHVEFPATVALARVEWNGVNIDSNQKDLMFSAAKKATSKFASILKQQGVNNPNSTTQLSNLLKRKGYSGKLPKTSTGLLSTSETELVKFKNDEIIKTILNYKKYDKIIKQKWLNDCYRGCDHRYHPKWWILGAATGRMSTQNPNIQGLPSIFKPIVTAPEGKCLIEFDFAQIEMGLGGAVHRNKTLIAAYNSGDIYSSLAQSYFSSALTDDEKSLSASDFKYYSKKTKYYRDCMKGFSLVVMYNAKAKLLSSYLNINIKKAQSEIGKFYDLFFPLRHDVNSLGKLGVIREYPLLVSGLRRIIPSDIPYFKKFNAMVNTPIQGAGAIVLKEALIQLDSIFRGTTTKVIILVHDSVLIECDDSQEIIDHIKQTVTLIMCNSVKKYFPELIGRVEINDEDITRWNKDGNSNSIEEFIKQLDYL